MLPPHGVWVTEAKAVQEMELDAELNEIALPVKLRYTRELKSNKKLLYAFSVR